MLQYLQIPEVLKTAAGSTFGGNIPWKMNDFFRTKNGFKKCILSQIELIRHWNKKTNFITTCLNFKLELIEHTRNRNSIFVGLVYTSAYWLRLCIKFYDSGKGKKRYQKCRMFNNMMLSGMLIPSIVLHSKLIWMLQCNSFFFSKTEGHLGIFKNWLFWLHWNEIFILKYPRV